MMLILVSVSSLSDSFVQADPIVGSLAEEIEKSRDLDARVKLLIYSDSEWNGEIQDGDYVTHTIEGKGNDLFIIPCGQTDVISVTIHSPNGQKFDAYLIKEAMILAYSENTLFFQETALNCSETGVFQEQSHELPPYDNSVDQIMGVIILIAIAVIGTSILLNYRKKRVRLYGF